MTQVKVLIVGTGNKTLDDLVKKRDAMRVTQMENFTQRNALAMKLEAEVDEAKKKRLQQSLENVDAEIADLNAKLNNVGVRDATAEEKREALQSITNMDERRRVAPSYLHPAKAFVLVPVEKPAKVEATAKPTTESAPPKTKKVKAPKVATA